MTIDIWETEPSERDLTLLLAKQLGPLPPSDITLLVERLNKSSLVFPTWCEVFLHPAYQYFLHNRLAAHIPMDCRMISCLLIFRVDTDLFYY